MNALEKERWKKFATKKDGGIAALAGTELRDQRVLTEKLGNERRGETGTGSEIQLTLLIFVVWGMKISGEGGN